MERRKTGRQQPADLLIPCPAAGGTQGDVREAAHHEANVPGRWTGMRDTRGEEDWLIACDGAGVNACSSHSNYVLGSFLEGIARCGLVA